MVNFKIKSLSKCILHLMTWTSVQRTTEHIITYIYSSILCFVNTWHCKCTHKNSPPTTLYLTHYKQKKTTKLRIIGMHDITHVWWCVCVRAGVNEYLAPCQALHQSLSQKACPWLKFILLISLILLDKWVGATLGAWEDDVMWAVLIAWFILSNITQLSIDYI